MQGEFYSGVSLVATVTSSAETTGTTEGSSSAATTETVATGTVEETTPSLETTSAGK